MSIWKCSICGASGHEASRKAAERAGDHHYLAEHHKQGDR